jgi:hypothetical protein
LSATKDRTSEGAETIIIDINNPEVCLLSKSDINPITYGAIDAINEPDIKRKMDESLPRKCAGVISWKIVMI